MSNMGANIGRFQDALERIALLDEADGHELTATHAFEAIGIATSTLGKHPSQISVERRERNETNQSSRSYGITTNDDSRRVMNEKLERRVIDLVDSLNAALLDAHKTGLMVAGDLCTEPDNPESARSFPRRRLNVVVFQALGKSY